MRETIRIFVALLVHLWDMECLVYVGHVPRSGGAAAPHSFSTPHQKGMGQGEEQSQKEGSERLWRMAAPPCKSSPVAHFWHAAHHDYCHDPRVHARELPYGTGDRAMIRGQKMAHKIGLLI